MSKILQIRTFSSLRRFVITSEAIIIKPISIKVPVSCHQQIRLFSKSKIFKQQSAAEEQMIKILADSFPGATGAVFKIRTKYLSLKAAPFGGTPTLIPVILILSIWCFICIYICEQFFGFYFKIKVGRNRVNNSTQMVGKILINMSRVQSKNPAVSIHSGIIMHFVEGSKVYKEHNFNLKGLYEIC